ncbi:MAG: carbohydrate ABC transporter substrate-binding protein [Mitsuaria chitosanitabida]|uniref:ABC transporter substrate-binding protein n=1 Tax=Roseateles chitosanitabidus TaxID=65048 RepID=UPI001B23EC4F|nr:ABC transporter substrate-binding protein [Roseateles chitosanitabidus]MBO9689732.1 carbohydrate ABC transporter substrate-binding protein [Roseateles chitosanitabidus]
MSLPRRQLLGLAAGSAAVAATAGVTAALTAPALLRAEDRHVVLRFAWWGGAGRHEATLKALALFERRHPGVKVKAEYMGFNGYLERLTTQIAGGSEPDVMQINWAWLAMFSKRGNGFADLRRHAELIDLSQLQADDIAYGDVAGKLNALPVSFSARVMLWNAAAFERAGLALPATWDELFAAGPVFKRVLGDDAYPLDGELYDMMLLSQAWVQQRHGMPYVDPAQPRVAMSEAAALDWVRVYKRLVTDHVATPLPLRASLGGAEKPTEQQPDWVVGRWAGNYTWDSVIALRSSTLDKQQRLALGDFPTLPGALDSGMFGRPTVMYAVSRHAEKNGRAEMAARLVNFLLTDREAAAILGRTRGLPSARGPYEQLKAAGALPPLEIAAHEQIRAQRASGRLKRPAPLFEHARLHKFMREVFETVAYGKTGDAEAARRLVVEGQALLQRIR